MAVGTAFGPGLDTSLGQRRPLSTLSCPPALAMSRNLADDAGTIYVVSHAEWDRHRHLATVGGHQAGPGLSWRELVQIAGTPDLDAAGIHAPHARLLLVLPALGDGDLPR